MRARSIGSMCARVALAVMGMMLPASGAVDTLRGAAEIEDAGIRSSAATNNCGACSPILLDNNTSRKMLIRIKSWGSVPVGATIEACTLVTTLDVAPSGNKVCEAYQCYRGWAVGTSSDATIAFGENAVTWNKYSSDGETDFSWGTAGCQNTSNDRSGTALSSVNVGSADPAGTVYKFPVSVGVAQAWRAGDDGGVVLGATSSGVFSFRSTENGTDANRPYFIVHYSVTSSVGGNFRQEGAQIGLRQRGTTVNRRFP